MTSESRWAVAGMLLVAGAVAIWLLLGTASSSTSGPAVSTAAVPTAPAPVTTLAPEPTSAAGPAASVPTTASVPPTRPPRPRPVVAWQPSHQDDTGPGPWREYLICSDIADRASRLLTDVTTVKAWDIAHGLYGSNNYPHPTNTRPFDVEVAKANDAGADIFISIHNDSEAPSGVLAECQPGDVEGEALARRLVERLSTTTGLRNRGVREVRLYSLEPSRNRAKSRCLLEIGDNVRDREFLEDPAKRQQVAAVLADVVRTWTTR